MYNIRPFQNVSGHRPALRRIISAFRIWVRFRFVLAQVAVLCTIREDTIVVMMNSRIINDWHDVDSGRLFA
jgi:hypothetical protein